MTTTDTSALNFGTTVSPLVKEVINRSTDLLPFIPVIPFFNAAGPVWNIDGSGMATVSHAEGSSFTTPSADTNRRFSLGWGNYETPIQITDEARARGVAGNPGAYSNEELRQILKALGVHAKTVQNKIFQGSGSNHIIGLNSAVAATGTYGGIDHAAVDDAKSYVQGSGSATVLTKVDLYKFIANTRSNSSERLNRYICVAPETLKPYIMNLWDTNLQLSGPTNFYGNTAPMQFAVDGVPFIFVDPADGYSTSEVASTNSIVMIPVNDLNPQDGVHLQVVPYLGGKKVAIDGLPLGMQVVEDPTGGHSDRFIVRNSLQLVVPNPKACGRMKDIKLALS